MVSSGLAGGETRGDGDDAHRYRSIDWTLKKRVSLVRCSGIADIHVIGIRDMCRAGQVS